MRGSFPLGWVSDSSSLLLGMGVFEIRGADWGGVMIRGFDEEGCDGGWRGEGGGEACGCEGGEVEYHEGTVGWG